MKRIVRKLSIDQINRNTKRIIESIKSNPNHIFKLKVNPLVPQSLLKIIQNVKGEIRVFCSPAEIQNHTPDQ